jgi:coxsackievirus/adenovirus receptor
VLFAYGPRDDFGGFPHCRAVERGARPKLTLEAEEDGELVVLVGGVPGTGSAEYTISARCTKGCTEVRCATLADLGCGDLRCDGQLEKDASGCATCACEEGALCGPDRRAGPGGSCVLPACSCDGVPSEPVCGADGRTWESPCAAACAGVPPAREGPCSIACPLTCDAPCHGLRKLAADGCPTCECATAFAADAVSCAACPVAAAPVCGSDGVTYPNACLARCAGARLLYAGACTDACRSAPPGCTLDCAQGLRPVAGGGHCLACACADVPASCRSDEGPVCATLPGPIGETTVGSSCLALALGASEGLWGPCGARCDEATPCPEGASCLEAGFLAGRCLVDEAPCGCSRLLEPVCGRDGETWDNACLARCAGVEVVHRGACCEAPPACESSILLDARGCPAGCGEPVAADCAANAATAPACLPDGTPVEGSACAAHARGESAFTEHCP